MKRRSAGIIILRTFFRSVGIIMIYFAVGVLSYYLTMLYYNQTDPVERGTQYTHVISVNTGSESSNLIYSYNKEKNKVDAVVLELFDEATSNLSYITIPANSQITINSSVYKEILETCPGVPQVVSLADIPQYFSGDVAYEYGIWILSDEIKVDIGYFTMFDSVVFHKYFKKLNRKRLTYYPSDTLLAGARERSTTEEMEKYIADKWDSLVSDITLKQKKHYAKALTKVNPDYIRGYSAYGTESAGVYTLNAKKNKKLVNSIWESEAYTSKQNDLTKSSKSKKVSLDGKTIQITNATGINGLAASYKQKLGSDGYEVTGVGNYVGSTQSVTTIYAKKKKWAKVLAGYFKNPTIMKGENLTNGVDIEIILGTADALK